MEQITCRTCLDTIPDKKKCREISRLCCLQKTVKEVIVMLVPEMGSSLVDNDCVCSKCFHTLKATLKFIARCLEVEMLIAEKRETVKEKSAVEEIWVKSSEVENVFLLVTDFQPFIIDHDYCINVDDSSTEDEAQHVNNTPENFPMPIQMPFESPLLRNALLNIKEKHNPPENVLLDPQSLHNELKGNDDIIFINDDLPPESLICDEIIDLEDSQPASVNPPESEEFSGPTSQPASVNPPESKPFSCSTCPEKFTCQSDYDLHLVLHPLCHFCGKNFKTKKALRKHIYFHTRQDSRVCDICGKYFQKPRALIIHIKTVHRTERTYMCDKCPKRFKTNLRLRIHIKVVHDRVMQQQCQECGKFFQNLQACKSHYRLVHLKIKPFACNVCGKEFGRKDYLNHHMDIHTGKRELKYPNAKMPEWTRHIDPGKPINCKVCGKTISSVRNLRAHLQTHARIRKYRCKYCDLTFTQPPNRDRHERLHEKDLENKFRCDICWKRMKTKEELENHVKAHSKVRPPRHSCDICGEKFHRKYLLDNHQLNEHMDPEDIKKTEQEMVNNLLQHIYPDSIADVQPDLCLNDDLV